MPNDTREPQSYGSQADWQSGKTGQQVHDPKSAPPPEHREFYESEREPEKTYEDAGGKVSPVQMAENEQLAGTTTEKTDTVKKVTGDEGGSKHDSYFKKRDYD